MITSILTSTKKNLGIAEDYTAFDPDVIMFINGVFSTLHQLGIGPEQGFEIEDSDATWDAFLGNDLRLNSVKTYVYLRVRAMFDPPTTQYMVQAINEQIKEHEWRLNVYRETTRWVDPVVEDEADLEGELVLDGGTE